MSRADSHKVGGGKADEDREGEEGGGVGGRLSKENGAGDGDCLSLSFRDICEGRVQRWRVTRDMS